MAHFLGRAGFGKDTPVPVLAVFLEAQQIITDQHLLSAARAKFGR